MFDSWHVKNFGLLSFEQFHSTISNMAAAIKCSEQGWAISKIQYLEIALAKYRDIQYYHFGGGVGGCGCVCCGCMPARPAKGWFDAIIQ